MIVASCGDTKDSDNTTQPIPNEDSNPVPTPIPVPVAPNFDAKVEPTFASVQKDLVNTFCVACHQGASAPAKLDLTDLSKFVTGDAGVGGYRGRLISPGKSVESMIVMIIITSNQSQKMPPIDSAYPAVKDHQLAALKAWIDSLPSVGGSDEPGGSDDGLRGHDH